MNQSFFNKNAFEVCVWSYEEKNRVKASKIYKVALQMEERYRKHHYISKDATRIDGGAMIEFARTEFSAMIKAKHKKKVTTIKREEKSI